MQVKNQIQNFEKKKYDNWVIVVSTKELTLLDTNFAFFAFKKRQKTNQNEKFKG